MKTLKFNLCGVPVLYKVLDDSRMSKGVSMERQMLNEIMHDIAKKHIAEYKSNKLTRKGLVEKLLDAGFDNLDIVKTFDYYEIH